MGFKSRGPKVVKFYHDDVHGFEGQPGDVTDAYLLTQHDGTGVVLTVPANKGESYCMLISYQDGRYWRIRTDELWQGWINLDKRHLRELARNFAYVVSKDPGPVKATWTEGERTSNGWLPFQPFTCDLCEQAPRWVHPKGGRRCDNCDCPK